MGDVVITTPIRIPRYISILEKEYKQFLRRNDREILEWLWGDAPEQKEHYFDDIFDLRKLFEEEPYDEKNPCGIRSEKFFFFHIVLEIFFLFYYKSNIIFFVVSARHTHRAVLSYFIIYIYIFIFIYLYLYYINIYIIILIKLF